MRIYKKPNKTNKCVKKRLLFLRAIGRWLKRVCITTGAIMLVIMIFTPTLVALMESTAKLPDKFVLTVDLSNGIYETIPNPTLSDPFVGSAPTALEIVDSIDRAAKDDRVVGILTRMGDARISVNHASEIRKAINRFRESGKSTYVYSSSWDKGISNYYLASAFDEIWMQPMGSMFIGGIRAEVPFLKGAIDELGIEPQMIQRKEYKSAYESVTRKDMSPKARESLKSLIDDIGQTVTKDISNDLGIDKKDFTKLVDKGIFVAPKALQGGLITNLNYADVLVENIKLENKIEDGEEGGQETPFVGVQNYYADFKSNYDDNAPKIALIYVNGAIVKSSKSNVSFGGIMGEQVAAADEIALAILDAVDSQEYEKIVIRIDSPGGSPVASETIARAIMVAKKQGIEVIVSMGGVAASGGYWIAAPADKIFAMPVTITGSIGVVGGKISMGGLWEKLHINWDGVGWGRNSDIWSSNTQFNKEQLAAVEEMLDYIYDSFIERVVLGRGMTKEDVEKIAKGRVWSGSQAKNRGLVDEFGGLSDALDFAARGLGAKDRAGVEVDIFPKHLSTIELIFQTIEESAQVFAMPKELSSVFTTLKQSTAAQGAVYEPVEIK